MEYKKISSQDNEQIKFLKKLGQKKYRLEEKKFIVENYAIIHDALVHGFDFESIFITEEFAKKQVEKLAFLNEKSKNKICYLIDDKLNKKFSKLDCPSGIAAVYTQRQSQIDLLLNTVYLNGISDPGNVGTILRTALAFGFKNIIVDNGCAEIYNPKTISAAKDAIFKLNIFEDTNNDWLCDNYKNYQIVVADSNAVKTTKDFLQNTKLCLVLGSESHGVNKEIVGIADDVIKINISSEIESLNVASAAAILLYNFKAI